MKFKEKRGNVFVFDGGYDSEELELVKEFDHYNFKTWITIFPNMTIQSTLPSNYKDIQTAVNLMGILKDEGLV